MSPKKKTIQSLSYWDINKLLGTTQTSAFIKTVEEKTSYHEQVGQAEVKDEKVNRYRFSGWRNDYCESEDELVRQFKAALQKKMQDMRREDEEAKRRVYNSGNSGGGK